MKRVTLSIITVNYNNNTGLIQTLESIKKQTFSSYEHIIIDANSTDGSKDTIKKYAKENELEIDFYVASEAGLTNSLGEWIDINCVFIENNECLQSIGTSQGFPIPDKYIEEIKETELGKVMDKIFSGKELGKGKGGISYLTKDEVSRIDLTRNAFIMALTKYINGDIWR